MGYFLANNESRDSKNVKKTPFYGQIQCFKGKVLDHWFAHFETANNAKNNEGVPWELSDFFATQSEADWKQELVAAAQKQGK